VAIDIKNITHWVVTQADQWLSALIEGGYIQKSGIFEGIKSCLPKKDRTRFYHSSKRIYSVDFVSFFEGFFIGVDSLKH